MSTILQWEQQELPLLPTDTLKEQPAGTVFRIRGKPGRTWIKVEPSTPLYASTLIKDVMTRGDCFAVSLDAPFKFTMLKGSLSVLLVNLIVKERKVM